MNRLSLTIDYAFKKFFVTKPSLLIDFLNAVFHGHHNFTIESLTILNPELPGEAIDDKNAILDILAKDSNGRMINIEMQAHEIEQFAKRSAFYAFRLYVSGIEKGENHADIPPVYSINLLDFELFPSYPYHRVFRILDVNEPTVAMMQDIEFHFVELNKLKASVAELSDPLEIWTTFIRNSEKLTEEEMATLEAKKPEISEAHKTLDEISMDSDARVQYDRRKSAIYFYEKTLERKFSDGKEEGILEEKLETARKMIEDDVPLAKVMIYSGLTEKELKDHKLI